MIVRVLKLGGSLLDLPDLGSRLTNWLHSQPPAQNIVVVGGGKLADALRSYDELHGLQPAVAHWLAVKTMAITARLVAELLPDATSLISDFRALTAKQPSESLILFEVRSFLTDVEPDLPGNKLAHDWSVTSDSIASRLASVVGANELVLLKSCDPPAETTVLALSQRGCLDSSFAKHAASLACIRWANLRANPVVDWRLSTMC